MFDWLSYFIAKRRYYGKVILDGGDYTFTDDGNGNITIAEE